jgi:hypothetical protein
MRPLPEEPNRPRVEASVFGRRAGAIASGCVKRSRPDGRLPGFDVRGALLGDRAGVPEDAEVLALGLPGQQNLS